MISALVVELRLIEDERIYGLGRCIVSLVVLGIFVVFVVCYSRGSDRLLGATPLREGEESASDSTTAIKTWAFETPSRPLQRARNRFLVTTSGITTGSYLQR